MRTAVKYATLNLSIAMVLYDCSLTSKQTLLFSNVLYLWMLFFSVFHTVWIYYTNFSRYEQIFVAKKNKILHQKWLVNNYCELFNKNRMNIHHMLTNYSQHCCIDKETCKLGILIWSFLTHQPILRHKSIKLL